MSCSRRTFLRGGMAGLITGSVSPVGAAEPVWATSGDVDDFNVLNDEIVAVGSRLRILDAATGQERRSVRLGKPSDAEGPATVVLSPDAIVFGWYVWHADVHVVCAEPQSLRIRWQRHIRISENERENIPYVFPLIRPDGIFVLVSNKHGENIFRLRPDTGDIVWSRYVERFAERGALAWHGNHLLVRSRVARGAHAYGDLHAIDPVTGASSWRLRLEGQDDVAGDTMLIFGNRAYITSPTPPGEATRLHIVDVAVGTLIKSLTIDHLRTPFAYHDGVLYFGGNVPTAWDVSREQIIWRTDLKQRRGRLLFFSHHPVLDPARRRIYLGEYENSFYVLSSTDGVVLGSVDVRRGHTNPTRIMGAYGASRLRLARDLLIVGAGDRRLFAYATAAL